MFKKIIICLYSILFLIGILFKFLYNINEILIYFFIVNLSISILGNICLIIGTNTIRRGIINFYKNIGYIDNDFQMESEKNFVEIVKFLGLRDLASIMILLDILIRPLLRYYTFEYLYTAGDFLLGIQIILFIFGISVRYYSNIRIKKYKNKV